MPRMPRRSVVRTAWLGLAICASVFSLVQAGAVGFPINVTPPTITGIPEVGQVLTASPGTWRDPNSPIVSYQYVWALCPLPGECVFSGNETSSSWELPWEAFDGEVEVNVVAKDEEGYMEGATSAPSPKIGYSGPYYGVSESVSGSGSVRGRSAGRPDSTLLCPGQCGYTSFIPGEDVELVAEPALGATFLGWGGACSGTSPTCSLTLGANESVTARFSTLPVPTPLPEGREADAPRESGGPAAGGAAAGAGALGSDGATLGQGAGTHLPARLLGLHALHALHGRHLQAVVACQQARACHLTLVISSEAPGARLIAFRSIIVDPRRRANIALTLDHAGVRLLARRRRLPVTAHLMLREGERSVGVGGAHLTLAA